MPTTTVTPRHFFKVRYDFRSRRVTIKAEASGFVDIYLVSEYDMDRFRTNHTFNMGEFRHQMDFKREVSVLPDIGNAWYLILENNSLTETVAVHYEVYA